MKGFIQKLRATTKRLKIKNDNFQTKNFDFELSLKRTQHFHISLRFKKVALQNGPTFG